MFRYNTLQTRAIDIQPQSIAFESSCYIVGLGAMSANVQPDFTVTTPTLPADEKPPCLFNAVNGSTFRSDKPSPKTETADVFHAATSLHGLPMAVILDGCGTAVSNEDTQKSAHVIMGLLEKLALDLHRTQLSDEMLHALVKERYRTLDGEMYGRVGDAVFSAIVTFKDHQGQLKTLSFGTGDTILATVNQNGTETVIAARNLKEAGSLHYRPLYFPSPKSEAIATQKRTLDNLEIDVRAVKPSDHFIFLTDGAYDYLARSRTVTGDDKIQTVRTTLKQDAIKPNSSISALAQHANQQAADDFKKNNKPCGDDLTIAELYIPTEQQQCHLQNIFYSRAKKALEGTLEDSSLPASIRQKFHPVKEKIEQLKNSRSPDLPALTKALIKTNQVIQYRDIQTIVDDYLTYVKTEVSQRNSFLWKALGIAMALAGITLILIGGLLGLNPTLSGGLVAGGMILTGMGATFFAQGYKKDLQKTMVNASSVLQQSSRP